MSVSSRALAIAGGADRRRLFKATACIVGPLLVWLAPLPIEPEGRAALAISAYLILAWMTELMEYSVAGLIGLFLFWSTGTATPEVIFSGFVNDASWFYIGAMLIGAMATKSGLPQRIGNYVVARVGLTYSRLVLGLIIVNFLLTFVVPSGAAVLVVMASIAIGVINLFGVEKGSNIGRGIFLVVTYTTTIFNKMVIAGTAAILARSIIEQTGDVRISWALWFAAFLPCAIVTIFASWKFTLWMFPPEKTSLTGKEEELKLHFGTTAPWTPLAVKSAVLSGLALGLWMTDWLHHVPPSMVAFGVGLMAFFPFVAVLDEKDFKQINLLPFFFVATALGMGAVLEVTGALSLLTSTFMVGIEPLLTGNELVAVTALYWGGFFYHMLTASEISMLVTSLPILMDFSKMNNLDPAWIGLIWSFASGGKLFAYESAVLVLGYSYGYFRLSDLIKIGATLTIVEFFVLAASVVMYWPFLGIG
jgi:anion transporter